MGYWIPVDKKERIFCSSLKDAYNDAAKILLGFYRRTNGNIHKIVPEYTGSIGLPIYNSASGKGCNHWVRFNNGSDPKAGYDEIFYDKRVGIGGKMGKKFPKDW